MRIKDRERGIAIKREKVDEDKEKTKPGYVSFGRIDRSKYIRARLWYLIIFLFLATLWIIYKLFFSASSLIK
jgi:uncharacterized membrane protein YhaH (DUF805 family)